MILYDLDVTGAFLNADIGETVYIELPDRLRPRTTAGAEQVWRLKETLYGLNMAPKAFYDDMAAYLFATGTSGPLSIPVCSTRSLMDEKSSSVCTSTTSPLQRHTRTSSTNSARLYNSGTK